MPFPAGIDANGNDTWNRPRPPAPTYSVDGGAPCTIADMYPDGDPDPDITALKVGERFAAGGGAAAEFTIERLS